MDANEKTFIVFCIVLHFILKHELSLSLELRLLRHSLRCFRDWSRTELIWPLEWPRDNYHSCRGMTRSLLSVVLFPSLLRSALRLSFGDQSRENGNISHVQMWLDALDLHLYGLGVWAGVLPSIGTHLSNRKVVINAWVYLAARQ